MNPVLPARRLKQLARQRRIAAYLMRGITNRFRLSEMTGVSIITIDKDLKAIRMQWRQDMTSMFEHAKEEQLSRIDRVEEKAWRGWKKSEEENGIGDPKFLAIVRKCVEDRRKMLGLDEPDKVDVKAKMVTVAVELQKAVEDNVDYIEFRRQQLLLGSSPISGDAGDQYEQRDVAAGETLDAIGYPVSSNGNGKASAEKSKRPRKRLRLD